MVLSFAVGLARLSRSGVLRFISGFYVEVIRGTSALVQLFYLFYILPVTGIYLDPFSTAVISETSEVSFSRSISRLPKEGSIASRAWGRMMRRSAMRRGMSRARAASHWPRSILRTAARTISDP